MADSRESLAETPTDAAAELLRRFAALLQRSDGKVPHDLLDALESAEEEIEDVKGSHRVADELEALIASNPLEDDIHQFFALHPRIFGHKHRYHLSERVIQGLLSKFPITPDRVPDFVSVSFSMTSRQFPNRVSIYELKRPDTQLFAAHARLSKDLNDAWMEAVESLRLIALSYSDFVRRAIKTVADRNNIDTSKRRLAFPADDYSRPRCSVRILIGRRASLSPEDIMRVRELGFATNFSIAIATYDALIDDLRGKKDEEFSDWRW